ncbi:MAG: translation initiation factor IF-2 [Candidatus Micrarchaeota archaeon]|nr:translation initiation factor IF-2 [Candidatus Micrarchaeota archaeon]
MIRQPIITVMGHVDHGKTSLLDRIRSSTIANREAGGITQHIGASEVPIDVIRKIAGPLLKKLNADLAIPGLLFIDTPGHEAFTNLRRRGGAVSDLAILVVDVSKGFEPQTFEAIDILKSYKTPFVVAANKIDLITGWRPQGTSSLLESLEKQQPQVAGELDSRVYELVGKLSELGFNSERFDRVKDPRAELSIIPLSAKTGEGIAELLVFTAGLAQRFLGKRLEIDQNEPGRGSIIEKKEERGLGVTLDVILYNGTLSTNDSVAFATPTGVKTAKIRALLKPKPLQEMRESSAKFYYVDNVSAASGVKISGSGFDDALAGSLIVSTKQQSYEKEIESEIKGVFETDESGIILKADTIGSIEAISRLLKNANVKISRKEIGSVTKRDVMAAFAMRGTDLYSSVVMAFNVAVEDEATAESQTVRVPIISSNIIYKLLDDYKEWSDNERKMEQKRLEESLIFPAEIRVLPNSCFRVSHPAVFGISVTVGRIKPGYALMNGSGEVVGRIKELQENGASLQQAKKGDSVAMSMEDVTFGRQVKEEDRLYTYVNDQTIRLFRYKYVDLLDQEEKALLDRIFEINKLRKKVEE